MGKKRRNKRPVKTELPVNQIICGHNIRVMRKFPDSSIDSIVTDPPYGIGFMGKDWDTFKNVGAAIGISHNKTTERHGCMHAGSYDYSRNAEFQKWFTKWAKECLRVAKPGAFMLVFGGTRTFHRLTCAIEDAGWQMRDCLMWLYGSGFPKSTNISKQLDKEAGIKRNSDYKPNYKNRTHGSGWGGGYTTKEKSATTELAKQWDGYGTGLKPAWEPIIVAMKPVDGKFAKNAEKWGVAGLNIDGGRISLQMCGEDKRLGGKGSWSSDKMAKNIYEGGYAGERVGSSEQGRWPANVILDEESAKILDNQEDVSRFFYIAKASREERNAGLSGMESQQVDEGRKPENPGGNNPRNRGARKDTNFHPTVKPLQLMQYLCMLLKMPGKDQVILDPFVGSGTTCIACKELGINYIGIDNNKDYCELARKRLKNVKPSLFEKPRKKMSRKTKESFGLV